MTTAAPETAAPATASPAKNGAKTPYHVLRERTGTENPTWYEPVAANVEASSAGHAIRKTVKETGTYIAIPSRSFTPTKVTISQETVITLG